MNLKDIRKKHNLTQAQVAKYLQTSQQAYNYYENEKYEPSIDMLKKLADLYRTSIDNIVGRENENEINISALNNKKIEFIKELVDVPDYMISELQAYLKGMQHAEKERQEIINEIAKLRGNKW